MRLISVLFAMTLAFSMTACKSASKKADAPATSPAAKVAEAESSVAKKVTDVKKKVQSEEGSLISVITCKIGGEERTLEVAKQGETGCIVNYTKSGVTKEIGSAQNGQAYCQQLATKVRGNLEVSGYKCQ